MPGDGWAQETGAIDAHIIDLRTADEATREPSRAAFIAALGEYGEIQLGVDEELRSILERTSYSPILEQGRVSLAATSVAYGALDCPGVESRSGQAILDLAAAMAGGADARSELHQVYLYRFLCADRQGQSDKALRAARMLFRIGAKKQERDWRPKEISEATWNRYPVSDAKSDQDKGAVDIKSDPPGATIWVDYQEQGITPNRVILSHGKHVIALAFNTSKISQEITVSGPGNIHLSLPRQAGRWQGMKGLVEQLQATTLDGTKAMTTVMAAMEADAAFVMREPGRVSVWVWRPAGQYAQHLGHAPNAKIAGDLVLQALADASSEPGKGSNVTLLLEEEQETKTRSSSSKRWWVYGVVLGAAAIGAGFIVAQDLSEDRQRIEVTLP